MSYTIDASVFVEPSSTASEAQTPSIVVAEQSGSTLVSWDQEMLERGRAAVLTATPDEILHDLL